MECGFLKFFILLCILQISFSDYELILYFNKNLLLLRHKKKPDSDFSLKMVCGFCLGRFRPELNSV